MSNAILMGIGRSLLGLYFLLPGVMKFVAWDAHIEMMSAHAIPNPAPLLLIATLAEIIAGICLILNYRVRFMALGCALLVIIINVMMHNFWSFDGVKGAHEMQNFIKNIGIFAGLLVLAVVSPKRQLLSDFWKGDGKIAS